MGKTPHLIANRFWERMLLIEWCIANRPKSFVFAVAEKLVKDFRFSSKCSLSIKLVRPPFIAHHPSFSTYSKPGNLNICQSEGFIILSADPKTCPPWGARLVKGLLHILRCAWLQTLAWLGLQMLGRAACWRSYPRLTQRWLYWHQNCLTANQCNKDGSNTMNALWAKQCKSLSKEIERHCTSFYICLF